MRSMAAWGVIAGLVAGCASGTAGPAIDAQAPAERVVQGIYRAADPAAPPVDASSLFANERFWPHQIQLTETWQPPGWEGDFGWGLGVLLEVSAEGALRVDFSRFGKHWIPRDVTDVVARANAVRTGSEHKYGPNLVVALKNRLLDPSQRTLREIEHDLLERRAFLLVFADPRGEDFPEIARAMARLVREDGLEIVLLAQGGHSDAHVFKACHEAGWPGSFLLDRFVAAYTEGFVSAEAEAARASAGRGGAMSHARLVTPEGRLLLEGRPGDIDLDRVQAWLRPGS